MQSGIRKILWFIIVLESFKKKKQDRQPPGGWVAWRLYYCISTCGVFEREKAAQLSN
jgi:hypothetical protein